MSPLPPSRPTALIAEDEPLLAAHLRHELASAWPELEVLAVCGNKQPFQKTGWVTGKES